MLPPALYLIDSCTREKTNAVCGNTQRG